MWAILVMGSRSAGDGPRPSFWRRSAKLLTAPSIETDPGCCSWSSSTAGSDPDAANHPPVPTTVIPVRGWSWRAPARRQVPPGLPPVAYVPADAIDCYKANEKWDLEEQPESDTVTTAVDPHRTVWWANTEQPAAEQEEDESSANDDDMTTPPPPDASICERRRRINRATLAQFATAWTAATSTTTSASIVSFGPVETRRYPVILGDHPYCTGGCPLTLGWDYYYSNDDDEPRRPRRSIMELRTTCAQRKLVLQQVDDDDYCSDGEIRRLNRQLHRERSCRAKYCHSVTQRFFSPQESSGSAPPNR
jgi:hypothetical protein